MNKSFKIFCLFFLISLPALADDMRFRKIGMNEGLSFNSVLSIIQDHQGLVWIGTRDGLNRYNGSDNMIYKEIDADPLSLSNNTINCLLEDSRHNIWIGTANGLNIFDRMTNKFRRYYADNSTQGISNRYVKCVHEDHEENIWVGTSNGIDKYDPDNDSFIKIRIRQIESNTNNIISIYSDLSGQLWFCTRGGLFFLNKANEFDHIVINDSIENGSDLFEIRDIKQEKDGKYWVATEKHGVFSFRIVNNQPVDIKNFDTRNSSIISDGIRKIHISLNNKIWFATLDGISIIDSKSEKITNIQYSYKNPNSLTNSSFHDIMEDSEGGFWLASYTEGVNYYHPQNNLFPHIKKIDGFNDGLNDDSINGFLEDGDRGIWIYTGGGGLNHFNNSSKLFKHYTEGVNTGLSNNNIKAVASDKDEDLWIGTYYGLNFFDRRKERFVSYFHDQENYNSLINNQIHAIHIDDDGHVWIGTNGGGVQIYDPVLQEFTSIYTRYNNINAIYEDRQKRIWIGSNTSLECVDRKSRALIEPIQELAKQWSEISFVNCISQDRQGRILIGTQNNGLFILTDTELFRFTEKDGLSTNTVNSIIQDDQGFYWISSNNGIFLAQIVFNSDKTSSINCTLFDVYHGLQAKQFYPNSALKASDGKLYFGGVNGYNAFYPDEIQKDDFFPSVALYEFTVIDKDNVHTTYHYPNQSIEDDSSIVLSFRQRHISVRFAGLNYVNPNELYYRYLLTGNDESWIDLNKERSINFTFLQIGTHELRLKSSTTPRKWADSYTSLRITVLPPWWKTIWAYTIYVVVISVLLFMFFRFSLLWARMKTNLQMEQFRREKEKELHESKLRFFTDISHELRTPLTLILAPLDNIISQIDINNRFRHKLLLMQRNGNRMIQLINQVLDMRKLETRNEKLRIAKGNIVAFLKKICLSFEGISDHKNINFNVFAEPDDIQLWYDKDKLEIVFYNLLSNAFKYTPGGGNVDVSINQSSMEDLPQPLRKMGKKGGVEIIVRDNGPGISEEVIQSIFDRFYSEKSEVNNHPTGIGLELAKRMVELHNGLILVESKRKLNTSGGITKFIVYLLKGKKHFNSAESISDYKGREDISQYAKDFLLKEKIADYTDLRDEIAKTKTKYEKKNILIVEDNEEVRNFIVDLLSDEYFVEEAGDGKKGLANAIQNGPDLIISDIMMPEMNGIELCKQIKLDSRTSHIPVILLTARTAITFKFEGFETGADEYITKPFSASFLKLRIRNLLDQREILKNHLKTNAIIDPGEISITSVDEKLLKKAVDYITQNISNTNITVNELSSELGLSRVHFYRKIKALTNLTAIEFIRSVRLRRACVLLEQNKFNIKEVKNLVGFENADYFRKCFKDEYGMTPSEYAAKHKEIF